MVLDSNVLLAALGTHGLCEAMLEACLMEHELFLCEPVLDELKEHLPGKFRMSAARVHEIVVFLKSAFTFAEPIEVPKGACRDPDDLMVLGTAIAAGADCIVTGDKDLLVLGDYLGVAIVSPRSFHARLK